MCLYNLYRISRQSIWENSGFKPCGQDPVGATPSVACACLCWSHFWIWWWLGSLSWDPSDHVTVTEPFIKRPELFASHHKCNSASSECISIFDSLMYTVSIKYIKRIHRLHLTEMQPLSLGPLRSWMTFLRLSAQLRQWLLQSNFDFFLPKHVARFNYISLSFLFNIYMMWF